MHVLLSPSHTPSTPTRFCSSYGSADDTRLLLKIEEKKEDKTWGEKSPLSHPSIPLRLPNTLSFAHTHTHKSSDETDRDTRNKVSVWWALFFSSIFSFIKKSTWWTHKKLTVFLSVAFLWACQLFPVLFFLNIDTHVTLTKAELCLFVLVSASALQVLRLYLFPMTLRCQFDWPWPNQPVTSSGSRTSTEKQERIWVLTTSTV